METEGSLGYLEVLTAPSAKKKSEKKKRWREKVGEEKREIPGGERHFLAPMMGRLGQDVNCPPNEQIAYL